MGKILDTLGLKRMLLLNIALVATSISLLVLFNEIGVFTTWWGCLVCFCWAFQESSCGLFMNAMCGFQWESKTTPFSVRYVV